MLEGRMEGGGMRREKPEIEGEIGRRKRKEVNENGWAGVSLLEGTELRKFTVGCVLIPSTAP